jgi:hypothetical protein
MPWWRASQQQRGSNINHERKRMQMGTQNQRVMQPVLNGTALIAVTVLFALSASMAIGQATRFDGEFVNVADSAQGFSGLSRFPAINNGGEVAFIANRVGSGQGVFKWEEGRIKTIASGSKLNNFGDDVAINSTGVVGYDAAFTNSATDRAIFTSNGSWTRTIVDANQQGFVGHFLGSPSINAWGTVAFFAFRKDFSEAVFTGDGGALTLVADTANGTFSGFGNAAINTYGQLAFPATREDGSQGVFVATSVEHQAADASKAERSWTIRPVTDPQNPLFADPFAQFGDPVINEVGLVADDGGFGDHLEIFTGNTRRVTSRTDPNSSFFTSSEHPSINDRGVVAFFASELGGREGVFVELTGGASPIAVIETGDALFGSIVAGLDLGRFALNDRDQLAFHYDLEDGRSGVAILSLKQR